jgi:hypothetical protein
MKLKKISLVGALLISVLGYALSDASTPGMNAMHQSWKERALNPKPPAGIQIPNWRMATNPVGFMIQVPPGWVETGNGLNSPWVARSPDGLFEVCILQNWTLPPGSSTGAVASRFLNQITGSTPKILLQDCLRDNVFASLGIVDGQNGMTCFFGFNFVRNGVPTLGVLTFLITAQTYVYTSGIMTYVLAPADRFDPAVQQVFAPMGASFWASSGSKDRGPDRDGDGVPDFLDRFPDDPRLW